MMFAWLVAQLVFWAFAMVATVAAAVAVVGAPPFFAGRYLWLHFR